MPAKIADNGAGRQLAQHRQQRVADRKRRIPLLGLAHAGRLQANQPARAVDLIHRQSEERVWPRGGAHRQHEVGVQVVEVRRDKQCGHLGHRQHALARLPLRGETQVYVRNGGDLALPVRPVERGGTVGEDAPDIAVAEPLPS
ncbi:MAG TPA: hypothetical protein VD978_13365 [Azospirillum sp.]|nr:hypothetical protein [Azospirillum sp.]